MLNACKTPTVEVVKDLRTVDARDDGKRNIKYEIIIPRTDNAGNRIRVEKLRLYALEIAREFYGMTMTPNQFGCYMEGEQLVCDFVMSIYAIRFDSDQNQANKDEIWMHDLASRIGLELGQDTILVITDKLESFTKLIKGLKKGKLPPEVVEDYDKFYAALRW